MKLYYFLFLTSIEIKSRDLIEIQAEPEIMRGAQIPGRSKQEIQRSKLTVFFQNENYKFRGVSVDLHFILQIVGVCVTHEEVM